MGYIPFAPPEAYADIFERYGLSPVVANEVPGYHPASREELRDAVEHVATVDKQWAQAIDQKELEHLFNLARRDWQRAESLYIHTQQVVRERYPERNREMMLKCHAYVGGIMWIFTKRSATVRQADKKKRDAGLPVKARTKQKTHPVDKKHPDQRTLL